MSKKIVNQDFMERFIALVQAEFPEFDIKAMLP